MLGCVRVRGCMHECEGVCERVFVGVCVYWCVRGCMHDCEGACERVFSGVCVCVCVCFSSQSLAGCPNSLLQNADGEVH